MCLMKKTSEKIVLSEEDRKELVKLYEAAEKTPAVSMIIGGRSLDDSAWSRVRGKMDELGKKYGFDPKKMKGFNRETGEIVAFGMYLPSLKKWDLDVLKKAGIDPTLKNYLRLMKDKSCKDCLVNKKWGACPAYPGTVISRSPPKRSAFARKELSGGFEGHVIHFRCPIIVHD